MLMEQKSDLSKKKGGGENEIGKRTAAAKSTAENAISANYTGRGCSKEMTEI